MDVNRDVQSWQLTAFFTRFSATKHPIQWFNHLFKFCRILLFTLSLTSGVGANSNFPQGPGLDIPAPYELKYMVLKSGTLNKKYSSAVHMREM